MRVLFIGDIVSKGGRRVAAEVVPKLRNEYDFIIANGENVTQGKGINKKHADFLLGLGIDLLTGGNHTFANNEILGLIEKGYPIIRPYNFPGESVAGKGFWTLERNGKKLHVGNLIGNTVFDKAPNPFEEVEKIITAHQDAPLIIDFHARTSEKVAMQFNVDGRCAAILGTHTHVPTADARVFPGGTGVITDVGMTGPMDSVIGVEAKIIVNRFKNGEREHFKFSSGKSIFRAAHIEINDILKRCSKIELIQIEEKNYGPSEDDS